MRVAAGLCGVGVVLLAAMALLGVGVMPSYLAAWLLWMALPLGALPLVMAMELMGVRGWALLPILRRMLLLLPVGAVLAIPVMLGVGGLYGRPGLPAWWMQAPFLLGRMSAMLAVWVVLAFLFSRAPAAPRRGLAVVGLMLHLVLGSLAALDWVMSLDAGLGSSAFGVVVMAGQAATALCAAAFLLALSTDGPAVPSEVPPLMIGFLLVWMFVQFIQYLVVWSANLPAEIVWYSVRTAGWGAVAVWTCVACALLGLSLLLPYAVARVPVVMAAVAAMLLLAHGVLLLWTVLPPFRGGLVPGWADAPALAALGGLAAFLMLTLQNAGERHAHA